MKMHHGAPSHQGEGMKWQNPRPNRYRRQMHEMQDGIDSRIQLRFAWQRYNPNLVKKVFLKCATEMST